MYLGEGYCGSIREIPDRQPLTLGPGCIARIAGAGGRGSLYLASARHIRPSHSPPRSPAQPAQSVKLGSLQGSWDWTACLPPWAFPLAEGKVVGRETHTGRGRNWCPIPKGSWHGCIFRPCMPLKQFWGVAVAEEKVFGSWFSFLSAPGWVRRPGCHPVLDPEFPYFTFH